MKPFCSIIIPAYNAEKTISSVLMRLTQETWKQTSKIIVINDGSNDNIHTACISLLFLILLWIKCSPLNKKI